MKYYVRFENLNGKGIFSDADLSKHLRRETKGFSDINEDLRSTFRMSFNFNGIDTNKIRHYFKVEFILKHFKAFCDMVKTGLVKMIRINIEDNKEFLFWEDDDQVMIVK